MKQLEVLPVALLMVACSASEPTIAKQPDHIARSKPRVDVVTRISCKPGSAERHANPEIHRGAEAKSNISAGVDQQEVRRS